MRIVIRTPNWLGDLMMSTAFMKAVLRVHPAAWVDIIVKKGFEDLPLPHRGECLVFDSRTTSAGRFGKGLRSRQYDLFYVLPPSFSSAWMATRSQAKQRIGYDQNLRGLLLKPPVPFQKKHRTQHIIDEYLQLLDLSLTKEECPPRLELTEDWLRKHSPAVWDRKGDYVVLAPGATYGPAKQWPVSYFKQLRERLVKEGQEVVVVGTEKERLLGRLIYDDETRNLCGKLTLNEFVAVLAQASALVSNDSGAMHVMAALQRPQVAIFGSSSPLWTGPVNNKAKVLYEKLDCSPCYKRKCPYTHYNCLNQIAPETVLKALRALSRPGVTAAP